MSTTKTPPVKKIIFIGTIASQQQYELAHLRGPITYSVTRVDPEKLTAKQLRWKTEAKEADEIVCLGISAKKFANFAQHIYEHFHKKISRPIGLVGVNLTYYEKEIFNELHQFVHLIKDRQLN